MAFQKWDQAGTWAAELRAVDDKIDDRMPLIELVVDFRACGYYRDGDATGPPEWDEERIPNAAYLVISDGSRQLQTAKLQLPLEWCVALAEYFRDEVNDVEVADRY